MEQEILTTDEATKYLKIGKRTLFKMVREGKIRALRVGNAYRFIKDELTEDLREKNPKVNSGASR